MTQQVNPVQKGDIDSLLNYLRSLQIDDSDLSELEKAISTESAASDSGYGPNVKTWLGGMISKAAGGAWKIGLQVAPKVLTDALNGYYGC